MKRRNFLISPPALALGAVTAAEFDAWVRPEHMV